MIVCRIGGPQKQRLTFHCSTFRAFFPKNDHLILHTDQLVVLIVEHDIADTLHAIIKFVFQIHIIVYGAILFLLITDRCLYFFRYILIHGHRIALQICHLSSTGSCIDLFSVFSNINTGVRRFFRTHVKGFEFLFIFLKYIAICIL